MLRRSYITQLERRDQPKHADLHTKATGADSIKKGTNATTYSLDSLQPGACVAHYVSYNEASTPEACASECFGESGCLGFSFGTSCALGCRISKMGHNPYGKSNTSDGQCVVDTTEASCTYYTLSFFHQERQNF